MFENSKFSENDKRDSSKFSGIVFLLETLMKYTGGITMGISKIISTIENDIRLFVLRLVRDLVIGAAFLFVGIGFIVFGVGIEVIELIGLGTPAGSVLMGTFFVLIGMIVFLLSRRK